MHTPKPSTSKDSLYISEEDRADLVNPITISSEASISQEDDFSQLKAKNTERSKRARRCFMSDSSDVDDTQNHRRQPSDSQYSSEDCQKNDNVKINISDVDTAKPRTSSDSVYSSGEDKVDLVNSKTVTKTNVVAMNISQGSSREDDFSQLNTKNTERSSRARRCVSSDSSGEEQPSQKSPRKPSSSQGSSKDRRKNNRSKRSLSNDSQASEKSDSPEPPKRNKKIRNAKQSPNKSSERKNKTPTKRKSSGDSLPEEEDDHSPPRTRNSKVRKKGRKPSPVPTNKASTSRNKKKSSKKRDSSHESSPEEDDSSEKFTRSEFLFKDVIDKYSKKEKKVPSDSSSSETENSQDYTISSAESIINDSESQATTVSLSDDSSDESQDQTKNKKGKRRARQLSSPTPEEASTSKGKTSNRKLSSCSSSSNDETDEPQIIKEGGSLSEEESDCKNSKEESDCSQVKEPDVSPKKYKNLKICSDTSDDEKEKKLLTESPRKINNVHLLKHKYKELMPKVTFGRYKEVHDIIFDGKTDDALVLPEFSQLLWRVVKSNKIDPDIASLLVRAGVDVNLNEAGEYSDSPGNSMLHVVAEKAWRKKCDQLALTLISYGANINKINGEGNSVLWSAVKGGSVIVVEELMKRGVEIGDGYNKVIRLAAESSRNSEEILPMLIKYGDADMETRDKRALYALRCLVNADGDLTAMRVLLDNILPLNDIDDDGNTLLIRAVIDSKFEMVKLLLEYGANPGQKRRDGNPPLWHAARQPNSAITGLLIKYGASVNDCNGQGQYPIHSACNVLSLENIKLLLYYGAEINTPDTYHDWTPFAMVNHQNLTDVTKLIIQHLAILNFNKVKIQERDIKRIYAFRDFRKYYAQCSSELHRMKAKIIYGDISLYCIFNYDATRMSLLINNSELIEEFHKMREDIQKLIPVYWPAIQKLMSIAWSRRDKLSSVEEAIREASNNVLTVDVCEKIARLACYDCLIDDEMKKILSS